MMPLFRKGVKNMTFKALLALGGTTVTFMFGSWSTSITILIVFMIIDFITGVMKGAYLGKLRSAVGYKGMIRKAVIMIVIIIAHLLDVLVSEGAPVFRTIAVYFYVGNELLSIIENIGLMGVPIPAHLEKYIEQLSDRKKNTTKP